MPIFRSAPAPTRTFNATGPVFALRQRKPASRYPMRPSLRFAAPLFLAALLRGHGPALGPQLLGGRQGLGTNPAEFQRRRPRDAGPTHAVRFSFRGSSARGRRRLVLLASRRLLRRRHSPTVKSAARPIRFLQRRCNYSTLDSGAVHRVAEPRRLRPTALATISRRQSAQPACLFRGDHVALARRHTSPARPRSYHRSTDGAWRSKCPRHAGSLLALPGRGFEHAAPPSDDVAEQRCEDLSD